MSANVKSTALVPGAVSVLLLLGLLTWLLVRGFDTNATGHAATLQAVDDYALAQASLHRDVLQARAGLLRNYDSLVKALDEMRDAVARLRSQAGTLDGGPTARLAGSVAEQEELTERFKTGNALLQNSLSYVGLLSTSQAFGAQDDRVAVTAGALAAAILYLTRDTSPDAVKALEERIERFAAQAPVDGPDAEAARALLAHTRLLHDLLPAVDETLRALVAVPRSLLLDEVRARFSERQSAFEMVAQRFRLSLYAVSLCLVIMLAVLALRLRVRALALRQRAAFEHAIAENSTRLINCPPSEIDMRLKQVLREFSGAIGAERAYVVVDERLIRVHSWSADGQNFPPGWPHEALALSARLQIGELDIVKVPKVAGLPPDAVRGRLNAVGIGGWVCAPLIRPGRVRGILGFDSVRPIADNAFPQSVIRLAADAIANALERQFLERDRTKLSERLERARRMQVVGSLASGIAHNFNNIIAAIVGYSEMLEPHLVTGSKPALHVEEIRRAAERGRDLVDNILDFGRRGDARVRALAVCTLFEEAASLLHASLPSSIELVIEDVAIDIAVLGEPAQLQQVILNLCTNAAQAITGDGTIRVSAERKEALDFLPQSHGVVTPGHYVCLAVSDSGSGIEESVARRLFEPFFTTRHAGTGLGLATVREIVREHNGSINVLSRPGQGSRFEVWLPAAPTDSSPETDPASPSLGQGQTVLLVEGEREQRLFDEEMLAALGYEPVGFEHVDDAIAACRSKPDRFDILLVCHASPPHTEVGVAQILHEIVPGKPLLLATTTAVDVNIGGLASAGITEVLRRPLASSELADVLARCLRPGHAISP
ncbi:MAG TPA: two-component system VirA-like sensor kinase [Xanthobacteraceae bacterium]|jgi:signal transduction histidine kinase|nr:two-component system VirA-like sensor kinase [Xanthobacteraceae bacterium]